MKGPADNEGLLRKISGQRLDGSTRIVWSTLYFYYCLEAIVWLVCGGVLAIKGVVHLLSWLF